MAVEVQEVLDALFIMDISASSIWMLDSGELRILLHPKLDQKNVTSWIMRVETPFCFCLTFDICRSPDLELHLSVR
jgi:hypothetical protein